MSTSLTVAPFVIDEAAIAQGILNMFDENERTALRFGLLPAEKMCILERALEEKFRSYGVSPANEDKLLAVVGHDVVEFSMRQLVSEATHKVCLALYQIGDLVV